MAGLTTLQANAIINSVLRNVAYTLPGPAKYLALFTADPTDAASFSNEVSFSGSGYARQAITLSAASGGVSANINTITFPNATSNWGTITHWAICDSSVGTSAALMLVSGELTNPKTITTGDQLGFAIGDIDITGV